MAIRAELDPSGGVSITVETVQAGQTLNVALFDQATGLYLTPNGWSKSRKTYPSGTAEAGKTALTIEPDIAGLIKGGATIIAQDIFQDYWESFIWPAKKVAEPLAAAPLASTPAATDIPPSVSSVTATPSPWAASRMGLMGALCLLLGAGIAYGAISLYPDPAPALVAIPADTGEIDKLHGDLAAAQAGAAESARQLRQKTDEISKLTSEKSSLAARLTAAKNPLQNTGSDDARLSGLQSQVSSLEQNLSQAQIDKSMLQARIDEQAKSLRARNAAPATPSANPASAELARQVADLQTQLQNMTVDKSMLTARIAEQEKLLKQRPVAAGGVVSGDTASLQSQISALQSTNAALSERSAAQTRTLGDWSNDRIDMQAKIIDLQKQLSQRVGADKASWLAAVYSPSGSVQAVENQTTSDGATSLAMKACGKTCKPIGTYQNTCFSLARPSGQSVMPGNWWTSTWPEPEAAARRAVYECEHGSGASCSNIYTVCSPASLKP